MRVMTARRPQMKASSEKRANDGTSALMFSYSVRSESRRSCILASVKLPLSMASRRCGKKMGMLAYTTGRQAM